MTAFAGNEAAVMTPPCPVCDATIARPRYAIEGLESRIVVCSLCGLGRLHPMPSEEEVRAFYPRAYYGHSGRKFRALIEQPLRLVTARRLRFLVRNLQPGARILDFGCGRGLVLADLADRGLEVHGVELTDTAVSGTDPRGQIRIASSLADAGYPADYMDRVIVWHVLEHVRDLAGTVAEVRRVLRPGGELVVAVPNFGSVQARWAGPAWFHLDPPRHLWHLPAVALKLLLRRHGLDIVSEHHFSLRQNPFGWVQSALNRIRSLPRNGLYELLHASAPGEMPSFTLGQRARLWVGWLIGMPFATALSVVDAARRSGATMCVVARKRTPEPS